MEASVYEIEAAVEKAPRRFVGRRRLFARETSQARIPKEARVLDIGTRTEANLRMLRELGFQDGTEIDSRDEAIRFCAGFSPDVMAARRIRAPFGVSILCLAGPAEPGTHA